MLLTSKTEIRAALATMHPIAIQASEMLAEAILGDPSLCDETNNDQLEVIVVGVCSIACQGAGMEAGSPAIDLFIANHGSAVFNLGVSVAVYTVKQQQKPKWLGAVGKVAAFGLGIAVGALGD